MSSVETVPSAAADGTIAARRRTADRIFRGTLYFNLALTAYWIVAAIVGSGGPSSVISASARTRLPRLPPEIGGALFGKQTLRVWGIGDVNRKSVGGTVTGLAGALVFCVAIVLSNGLGGPWLALAVVIAVSTTALELFSLYRVGRLGA